MFNASRTLSAKSPAIPIMMGDPGLIPVSIKGVEQLNRLFQYTVILKTPDHLTHLGAKAANYELKTFIGQPLTVEIQLEGSGTFIAGMVGNSGIGNMGAGTREISGIITAAKVQRQVGRYVYYAITLEPWLKLATYNADYRIFQDKTPLQIIDEVLARYNFPVEKRLFDLYSQTLDYTTQHGQSDWKFFSEFTERFGINYFFEHNDGHHTLILTDANQAHKPCLSEAYHVLKYIDEQPNHIDEEYIGSFTPIHRLTAGTFSSREYDYTRPRSTWDVNHTDPAVADQAEVYTYGQIKYVQEKAGAQQENNEPLTDGSYLARINMERLRSDVQRAQGSGSLRGLSTGGTFEMTGHPTNESNTAWLVISTALEINEVGQETQRTDNPHQQFHVHCDFDVVPLNGGTYRPALITSKPIVHTATARVVGPANQPVWTDYLGRVKIQFPWDRLDKDDQTSSCWVRVSDMWSGNQLGGTFIPRVGSEVLVAYIGGNPDLPIVIGYVNNQNNLPPWILPGQQALSGIRSKEHTENGGNYAGGRSNHFLMDDTQNKMQTQLHSAQHDTQLNLGFVRQVDGNAGCTVNRGQGYEIVTQGHGVHRSNGMLLTTEKLAGPETHMTEMGAVTQRLSQARDQHEILSDLAQHHLAQDNNTDQSDVTKAIKAQNDGIKGAGGDPAAGKFPELSQPHLVLASSAGIEATAAQSTHIASGEHTAITTGQHLSMSVGKSLFTSIADKWSVFVHNLGIKLFAANGKVQIQAQNDNIELTAKKVLALISQSDWIDISGKKGVRLHGPGGMLELGEVVQFCTKSPVLFHGSLETLPSKSTSQTFNELSVSDFDQEVRFLKSNGKPAPKAAYDILRSDGNILDGKTASSGETQLQKGASVQQYSIRYKGELP